MALLLSLREFGRTFATRERGAEIREELLARAVGEDTIVIDFADVTHVSFSFADELIGKLLQDGPRIELNNLDGPVARTVERARTRPRVEAASCR